MEPPLWGLHITMQSKAADIILGNPGKGDGFTIRYGWFRFHLVIRPLTARQVIEISREVCNIPSVSTDNGLFPEELAQAESLEYICRSIAIATGTKWQDTVTKAISKLPLNEIATLWGLVIKASDPKVFFSLLLLTKGMNKITTPKAEG